MNVVLGTIFQVAFFGISELLPLISFIIVSNKFVDVMDERDNQNREGDGEGARLNQAA